MIRQWGAVLMAAAGLTLGSGAAPMPAVAAGTAVRPPGAVQRPPGHPGYRAAGRQNQTITFSRNPELAGDTIRATARGPVDGFGEARVLDFRSDPASGSFRGVWELAFRSGSVRYSFSGATRDAGTGLAVPERVATTGPADGDGGPVELVDAQVTSVGRALVAGDFTLSAGTGRFAGVIGRGAFRGWTLPEVQAPPRDSD